MNKYLFTILATVLLFLVAYKVTAIFADYTYNQEQDLAYLESKIDFINYSGNELSHMQDVRRVLFGVDVVLYILLFIITFSFTRTHVKEQMILLKRTGISTFLLSILIGIFSLFSFDTFFTYFHNIFFPQGNWQFASSSIILQTWPTHFFIAFSINMLITVSILATFLMSTYLMYRYAISNSRD